MSKGIIEILPLVQGLSKSRPASGILWSFLADWKLDVGDPAFMSSKKAEKKEERGCAGQRAFIGQTRTTCLVPLMGAERLPNSLMWVCDGQDKGSVTGHSAESSRLSSLGVGRHGRVRGHG